MGTSYRNRPKPKPNPRIPDKDGVFAMVAVGSGNESAGEEDHEEDHTDEQPHEGVGTQRTVFQKLTSQRAGYRRRFSKRLRRKQRIDDHEPGFRFHKASDDYRRGGDAEYRYAAGPPEHTARTAIHNEPHEEGRRGG